ncbi:DUF2793 domain-containing protein [Henriciella sp.]|uniref:DUF2793 domain-containing protein n=1 Tax=Henriciella sp. TaxID=1968823 RepID=UPI000C0FA1DA|nr:DUF2793 domain-containing protein [Henriciella sp.]PHR81068.1 MAG: hypothetical protein COA64_03170 [Henriciella sp.]
MDTSPRLGLPFLLANQAQKHVTLNEALRRLDMLIQLAARSASTVSQPAAPAEGDIYLLGADATGTDWSGAAAGSIAAFADGAWTLLEPEAGWRCHIEDELVSATYSGTDWVRDVELPRLGINSPPDESNRLAVKSDAVLFSHDDVTPGSGDVRQAVNKAAEANTASLIFQSGYSARAELGLLGGDDFAVKVSSDGMTYAPALQISRADGSVSFPGGQRHETSGEMLRSILPVAGGDGISSVFRIDVARSGAPRGATISAVSGAEITLSSGDAASFFEQGFMGGVSMVRIWNVSRSPEEAAWVTAAPGSNMLTVSDFAAISAWLPGDTIQIGDPAGMSSAGTIALDVSPMMQQLFGTVFRQAGLILKVVTHASSTADTQLDVSPSGASGSFLGVRSYGGEKSISAQLILLASEPSPVSDTNLLYIREVDLGGGMGISVVTVTGFLV